MISTKKLKRTAFSHLTFEIHYFIKYIIYFLFYFFIFMMAMRLCHAQNEMKIDVSWKLERGLVLENVMLYEI